MKLGQTELGDLAEWLTRLDSASRDTAFVVHGQVYLRAGDNDATPPDYVMEVHYDDTTGRHEVYAWAEVYGPDGSR